MIKWPNNLISDIARRRCVLVLGAGVSRNSQSATGRRPKTWYEFLHHSLSYVTKSQHIKSLLKNNDYLTACEVIKRDIGRERFTDLVRDEFLTPRYMSAPIHERIFALDSRIVITPNFDKIYETYANHQAGGSIVVKHHYDNDVSSVLKEQGRLIIKIHGTIDTVDRMVFTRAEYAEARSKYSNFYALIEALSVTHTFVFIGCGINDPDIRLLLEDTFFKHKCVRPHVMLLPKNALHHSVVDVVQETMNLKIIKYNPSNHHEELSASLLDLSRLVEQERDELRNNGNW